MNATRLSTDEEREIASWFIPTLVWGIPGVMSLLYVAKTILEGGVLRVELVVLLAISVITLAGLWISDSTRRTVGKVWLIVTALSFLGLIVGGGLGISWIADQSLMPMLFGTITAGSILPRNI